MAGNLKDLARLTENVPAGGFPGGELEGITRVLNDSAEVEENREPGESESSDDTIDVSRAPTPFCYNCILS